MVVLSTEILLTKNPMYSLGRFEMRCQESIKYYGSKEWADEQLRYLLGLLSDNSTWNLPHNWYAKRVVAHMILQRFKDGGFDWHFKVGSGHFHRWLKRKSWEAHV